MAGRSDFRFNWFGKLSPIGPVLDPRLGIDQLEDAHSLEIGDRPLARECLLHGQRIDDPVRG